MIITLQ